MDQIQNQAGSPDYAAQHVPPPAEEPARLGPVQRLTGTLFSPGETFKDVNRKPTWLAAMLITVATIFAFSAFFEWRVKPDWERFFRTMVEKQLERSGQKPPKEQIDQQVALQAKFARTDLTSPLSLAIGVGKSVVYAAFVYFIPTGLFALGLMLMQGQTTFKRILSVVSWSGCATGLVYYLVIVASLLVRDRESLSEINLADQAGLVPTNLAAVLPSGLSPVLLSIGGSIDFFSIWNLVLLCIGFAAISGRKRFTPSKAASLVFGLWVIWVLIKAGFAALGFGT